MADQVAKLLPIIKKHKDRLMKTSKSKTFLRICRVHDDVLILVDALQKIPPISSPDQSEIMEHSARAARQVLRLTNSPEHKITPSMIDDVQERKMVIEGIDQIHQMFKPIIQVLDKDDEIQRLIRS